MKEIVLVIAAIFRLLTLFFDAKMERKGHIKKLKEEAKDEILKGLVNSDSSLFTSGFDKLNRVREL